MCLFPPPPNPPPHWACSFFMASVIQDVLDVLLRNGFGHSLLTCLNISEQENLSIEIKYELKLLNIFLLQVIKIILIFMDDV